MQCVAQIDDSLVWSRLAAAKVECVDDNIAFEQQVISLHAVCCTAEMTVWSLLAARVECVAVGTYVWNALQLRPR